MKAEERRFSRSVFIRPHSSLFLLPQKDRAEIALQLLELIGGRIIHEDHVAGDFLRLLCRRINARGEDKLSRAGVSRRIRHTDFTLPFEIEKIVKASGKLCGFD